MIYVLKQNGVYKIGCTGNLKQRYRAKRTRQNILLTIERRDGGMALEAKLHNRFAHLRARSPRNPEYFAIECFELGSAEIAYLYAIPGAVPYREE